MGLENTLILPYLHSVANKQYLHIAMTICFIFSVKLKRKVHLIYETRPF